MIRKYKPLFKKRYSFTLVEVFVSILLVGGAFALFIPAIKAASNSYCVLRAEGNCQSLADEYFAQAVLELISKELPKDAESFTKKFDMTIDSLDYHVSISLKPDEASQEEDQKEKYTTVLNVEVSSPLTKKLATRETKLCVAIQK